MTDLGERRGEFHIRLMPEPLLEGGKHGIARLTPDADHEREAETPAIFGIEPLESRS